MTDSQDDSVHTQNTPVINRYRQAGKSAIASIFARGVSVLAAIAIVPLALAYLGTERYGLWLTLSSFLALLGFMDIGLGNAVMTGVSRTGSGADKKRVQEVTSSGFFIMAAVAAVGAVAWIAASRLVDIPGLLNVGARASAEASTTLAVLVGILLLNLPLAVAGKAQWGLQRGYVDSLWQAGGSVVSIVVLLAVIQAKAGLPWIALAIAGGTLAAATANSATTFLWWGAWLRPRLAQITGAASRELAKLGVLFLGLQMAVVVAIASDNVIVARLLGLDEVPNLAVPFKLFAFVPMLLAFALTPLWPAYGDAIAKHDAPWVRVTLKRSLIGAVAVSATIGALFVIAGNHLLDLWTGGRISASISLLVALALWVTLSAAGNAIAMLLNGGAVVAFQLATSWSMAIVAVILKIVLVPNLGVAGAVWATVIAYAVFIVIPDAVYVPRFLRKLEQAAEDDRAKPLAQSGRNWGGRSPTGAP